MSDSDAPASFTVAIVSDSDALGNVSVAIERQERGRDYGQFMYDDDPRVGIEEIGEKRHPPHARVGHDLALRASAVNSARLASQGVPLDPEATS